MSNQDISIEIDMLKGNINRMCVTDDREELDKMFFHAIKSLNRIHDGNFERIRETHINNTKETEDILDNFFRQGRKR